MNLDLDHPIYLCWDFLERRAPGEHQQHLPWVGRETEAGEAKALVYHRLRPLGPPPRPPSMSGMAVLTGILCLSLSILI